MLLDETTLPAFARGAAILGAGGGGGAQTRSLAARQAVEEKGPVEVISLDDVPDDDLIAPVVTVGSSVARLEKLGNPEQGVWLREMIERETGKRVAALMPTMVSGAAGLFPVACAAHAGLPVVDADGSGRMLPRASMNSMHVAGIPATPAVLTEERGFKTVLRNMDVARLGRAVRAVNFTCGGSTTVIDHVFTGAQAGEAAIAGSLSRAVRIGQVLAKARTDGIRALLERLGGRVLITGKISHIERHLSGVDLRGHAILDGVGADRGRLVRLEVEYGNLLALENGELLASVPDIITLLNAQTGDVIFTETMRYGQRAAVVALPSPDIWRTPEGLALVGPRAFGYDFDYRPLEPVPPETAQGRHRLRR